MYVRVCFQLMGMVRRRYPSGSRGIRGMNGGGMPWNYLRSESRWGRQTFHLAGMDQRGRGRGAEAIFARAAIAFHLEPERVELVGMEACGGSHFLGRALRRTRS